MFEHVTVAIVEEISKKSGKPYTAVYLIFDDGEKILAGTYDLANKLYAYYFNKKGGE